MDRFEIYLAGEMIRKKQRDEPEMIPKFLAFISGWLVMFL